MTVYYLLWGEEKKAVLLWREPMKQIRFIVND